MSLSSVAEKKDYEVGDWVLLSDNNHKEGIIMYIGKMDDRHELQYGIELTDFSVGTHNSGDPFFDCKDKMTKRVLFMFKSQIKRCMRKSDFRKPNRIETRKQIFRKLSYNEKVCFNFDPIIALTTIEIIEVYLGQHWLRYICLFLPTLDKFALPAVCKLFHRFTTLERGQEDRIDPPPINAEILAQLSDRKLIGHTKHRNINSNSNSSSSHEVQTQSQMQTRRASLEILASQTDLSETPPPPTSASTTTTKKSSKKNKKHKKTNTKNKTHRKQKSSIGGGKKSTKKGGESAGAGGKKSSSKNKKSKNKKSPNKTSTSSKHRKTKSNKLKGKRHTAKKSIDSQMNATPTPIPESEETDDAYANANANTNHNNHSLHASNASTRLKLKPRSPIPSNTADDQHQQTGGETADEKADREECEFMLAEYNNIDAMLGDIDNAIIDEQPYHYRLSIVAKMQTAMKQLYDIESNAINLSDVSSNASVDASTKHGGRQLVYTNDGSIVFINNNNNNNASASASANAVRNNIRANDEYRILGRDGTYAHILWLYACEYGNEKLALDRMTRKCVENADRLLFDQLFLDDSLVMADNAKVYKIFDDQTGRVALDKTNFLKFTPFQRNAISYFLTFQLKLSSIYTVNMVDNEQYIEEDVETEFCVQILSILNLDLSSNDVVPFQAPISRPPERDKEKQLSVFGSSVKTWSKNMRNLSVDSDTMGEDLLPDRSLLMTTNVSQGIITDEDSRFYLPSFGAGLYHSTANDEVNLLSPAIAPLLAHQQSYSENYTAGAEDFSNIYNSVRLTNELHSNHNNHNQHNDSNNHAHGRNRSGAVVDARKSEMPVVDIHTGAYFLQPMLRSPYCQITSLNLSNCNLVDTDLSIMCHAWGQRAQHSALQVLNLSQNAYLTDARMDDLFDCIAKYMGNLICLMLHQTGITDGTCATVLNFYKAQFTQVKKDAVRNGIKERYNWKAFDKELNTVIKVDAQAINWQHKNPTLNVFMKDIAIDYGLFNTHYDGVESYVQLHAAEERRLVSASKSSTNHGKNGNNNHNDNTNSSSTDSKVDEYNNSTHQPQKQTRSKNKYDNAFQFSADQELLVQYEKAFQETLAFNEYTLTDDNVEEYFGREVERLQLMREQQLLVTPALKKRSKLKQIRLHLNPGLTRTGFSMLNEIFRHNYIAKDTEDAAILIDGLIDDGDFKDHQTYAAYQIRKANEEDEYRKITYTIRLIDKYITAITAKIVKEGSSERRLKRRRKLTDEKERLVARKIDLFQSKEERKENPMTDPKRDVKWDLRLLTDWGKVWDGWIDTAAYADL